MVNESVLNGVRKYLRALQDQGVAVKFGIVFGSQVAGNTDTWSDRAGLGKLDSGISGKAALCSIIKYTVPGITVPGITP